MAGYNDEFGNKVLVSPSRTSIFGRIIKMIDKSLKPYINIFKRDITEREIEDNPERFSPNVLLRPLYQETILPNLAYIGGAAEIAYWLQLKKTFDSNNIIFPILVPRNSVLWINNIISNKLSPKEIESASNKTCFK